MRRVKILCGVSGSGKSTYIKNHYPSAFVVSTDHFFMSDGEYKFDPNKLPQAHAACLREFVNLMITGFGFGPEHSRIVCVDNTNTSLAELAPYAALALAYEYELEILVIDADPDKAHARNSHGVLKQGVMNQNVRLHKLGEQLPPWWPVRRVAME